MSAVLRSQVLHWIQDLSLMSQKKALMTQNILSILSADRVTF